MSEEGLSYPYKLYHKTPFHPYNTISVYNHKIKQCHNIINMLKSEITSKKLFHITIGASMEEMQRYVYHSDYNFQWQQLLPFHIVNFLKQGGSVEHIIISPNASFCDETFLDPFFIKFTPEFNWVKVISSANICHYASTVYDYNVRIFCTMMPSIDINNNIDIDNIVNKVKFTQSFKSTSTDTEESNVELIIRITRQYIQTEYDRQFVKRFYTDLFELFSIVNDFGGIVTCFSFAVFNELCTDVAYKYKNYRLCPEIIDGFKNHKNLLAEWVFTQGNYCMRYYKNPSIFISYIKPTKEYSDGHQIVIYNDTMIDKLIIKFVESNSFNSKYNKEEIFDLSTYYQNYTNDICSTICITNTYITNTCNTNTCNTNTCITDELENEYQIRKHCILVIKKHFNQTALLEYIKNISDFKEFISYGFDDKTIMGTYYELLGLHPDNTVLLREKYNIDNKITYFGIVELFALSYLLNTTLLINTHKLHFKIKHPIVSNGSYIDIMKKYNNSANLFIINKFI
jgi:hypothetical protein